MNKLAADIEGVREALNGLSADCLRLEMEIKRVSELAAGYEKTLAESGSEEQKLKDKAVQANRALDETLAASAETDKKILEKEAELAGSQEEQEKLKDRRNEISGELSELRVKGAELSKDIEKILKLLLN